MQMSSYASIIEELIITAEKVCDIINAYNVVSIKLKW